MKKIIAPSSIAIIVIALSACTENDRVPEQPLVPHAGEAVQRNIAVQLVNPAAPTGDEAITMNGERAAIAQDRYRTDRVKEPARITNNVNGGAGGGGGGGSAGVGSGGGGTP